MRWQRRMSWHRVAWLTVPLAALALSPPPPHQAKDYEKAIEWYSKAVNADPKNATFYSNRSAAYLALKNFGAAAWDGQYAINCKPSWKKGYFRKATAQIAAGKDFYAQAYKTLMDGRKAVGDILQDKRELEAKMQELWPKLTPVEQKKFEGNK